MTLILGTLMRAMSHIVKLFTISAEDLRDSLFQQCVYRKY